MDDEERVAWGAIGFGVGWVAKQLTTRTPSPVRNPLEDMWMTVTFPDYTQQIADLQALVRRQGITFDSGYGPNGRDWELDWSLEGATVKQILQLLNNRNVEYTISNVREVGYNVDGTLMEDWSETDGFTANPKVRRLSKDAVTVDTGLLEYFNFEDLNDDDEDDDDDDWGEEAKQAYGVPKSEWQMNDDEEKNTLMNIKYLISSIRIDEVDYGIVEITLYSNGEPGRRGSYVSMKYNVMTEERVGDIEEDWVAGTRPGFIEMAKSILLDDEGWSEVFGNRLYSMY